MIRWWFCGAEVELEIQTSTFQTDIGWIETIVPVDPVTRIVSSLLLAHFCRNNKFIWYGSGYQNCDFVLQVKKRGNPKVIIIIVFQQILLEKCRAQASADDTDDDDGECHLDVFVFANTWY